MGKMACRCGYTFDTTPSPEPNLWIAVTDANYETFICAEAESNELSKEYDQNRERVTQLDRLICDMRTLLYNCPQCMRIYWFRGEDGQVEVFAPKSGGRENPSGDAANLV